MIHILRLLLGNDCTCFVLFMQAAPSFPSSFPHLFEGKENLRCLIPCAIDQVCLSDVFIWNSWFHLRWTSMTMVISGLRFLCFCKLLALLETSLCSNTPVDIERKKKVIKMICFNQCCQISVFLGYLPCPVLADMVGFSSIIRYGGATKRPIWQDFGSLPWTAIRRQQHCF